MKLVNEKGRLFGLVNPIDLLMLAALAVVIFMAVRLSGGGDKGVRPAEYVEVTFTVRLQSIRGSLADGIASSLYEGAPLVAEKAIVPNFYVADVKVERALIPTTDSEGNLIDSTSDPLGRKDIVVTLRGVMVTPEDPIYKVVTQEVRIGRAYFVKTSTVEQSGLVESFEAVDLGTVDGYNPDDPESWEWELGEAFGSAS